MISLLTTHYFDKWLISLKDREARRIIRYRLDRIETTGNFGDAKSVGEGIFEIRIDFGAGYRIYYKKSGNTVVILLCGGIKSTQSDDIKKAKEIAKGINNE
jgi:putative addiction module killer protein